MTSTISRLAATAAAAIVALGALGGCSEDDPDQGSEPTQGSDPEPTDDTTTEPATEPATPAERAAAAVERFLEVRDDAYRANEVDLPRFRQVATGQAFVNVQAFVAASSNAGTEVTGEYEHTVGEPVGRDSSTYLVPSCEDRSNVRSVETNGRPTRFVDENGEPLRNPLLTEYTVTRDGGRWKVDSFDVRTAEPC